MLLGAHVFRECQMLAVPSFETEWAVYIVRDEETMQPTLIVKEMELHLWPELHQKVIESPRRDKFWFWFESEVEILATMPMATNEWRVRIDGSTADLLATTWATVIQGVRYVVPPGRMASDGTRYHAGHCDRSGQTWSPDEGTLLYDFVELAEAMRVFGQSVATEQPLPIEDLRLRAKHILQCLEQQPR